MGRFFLGPVQDRLMLAHDGINALQALAEHGLDQEHGVNAIVALCRFRGSAWGFFDDEYVGAGPGARVGGRDFSSAHAAVWQLGDEVLKAALGPCLEREFKRQERWIVDAVKCQQLADRQQGFEADPAATRVVVEGVLERKLLLEYCGPDFVAKELPAIRRRMKGFAFMARFDLESLRALVVREAFRCDAERPRPTGGGRGTSRELAEKHGVDPEKLRKRLDTWRQTHHDAFIETESAGRRPRDPRFLYDEEAVMPVILALQNSGGETAAKKI
jgi:hypothetical protein